MIKRKHTSFILTPIANVLEEAINATSGIRDSISTFPVWEYILQSVFLRMTGFQEQKLKCIIWELATDDYEYRYKTLQSKLGECSNFDDKKNIFKDLIKVLKAKEQVNILIDKEKLDLVIEFIKDYTIIKDKDKDKDKDKYIDVFYEDFKVSLENSQLVNVFKESFKKIDYLVINSRLEKSRLRDFNSFKSIYGELVCNFICLLKEQLKKYIKQQEKQTKNNSLVCDGEKGIIDKSVDIFFDISGEFNDIYKDYLYKHRNRVAHNLLSYQQNLPTLSKLKEKNNKYENYFLYFFMLILIDELFMFLYKKYLNLS